MTKISDATLVASATDNMKMPTGEVGDLAVSVGQIKTNVLTAAALAYDPIGSAAAAQAAAATDATTKANAAQAFAIQRDNHTGTQLASTISDFNTAALAAAPAETINTIGLLINGSSSATPNDTDFVATADTSVLKKITWTSVKAFLKTYFDSVYTTTAAVATQITTALAGYLTAGTAAATYEPIFSVLGISKGGTNSSAALNNNRVIKSSGGAIIEAAAITAARALKSDANGIPTHFDTATEPSLTELAHVKGVTSAIQPQLNELGYWRTLPGTPVRSSNTVLTITDTANANLYDFKFNRGTVLKWTDTTVKQAMVVSATYAANTVTITIIGDVLSGTATMNTFKYAIEKAEKVTFAIAGTLATGTNLSRKWKADKPYRVFGSDGLHGTAGTTNATTYDINKNGTTIFATKLSIASTATVGNGYTADDGASLALDDVLSLDCDSVSTTAPIDAYVDVFIFPTYNQYL